MPNHKNNFISMLISFPNRQENFSLLSNVCSVTISTLCSLLLDSFGNAADKSHNSCSNSKTLMAISRSCCKQINFKRVSYTVNLLVRWYANKYSIV